MLPAIYSQILFYLSIALTMFLPGYFLLLTIFRKDETQISHLERFVFSFGLGLIVTDFIAFAFSKLHISITATSSVSGSLIFCAVCFAIYKFNQKNSSGSSPKEEYHLPLYSGGDVSSNLETEGVFSFSKNQSILIFLFLFLTIFIKTAYLSGTVAPTTTDMGHHTYWVKTIVESGQLPTYDGMPDFIIGEHVVLGEMAMINGLSFFSAFPVVFLFLINLLSILMVFLLTLRIFKSKNIAILTLLFLGVLFAVSSPQAKFVSGGVMGNIMGNFLMPLAFYFYYRAMEFWEKENNPLPLYSGGDARRAEGLQNETFKSSPPVLRGRCRDVLVETEGVANARAFLSLAIFTTFGLFYTHHLTAFIFLFVLTLLIPFFLIINFKESKEILTRTFKLIFSVPVMATFFTGLIFFFFVFTPNYVKTSAVGSAVGAPSKSTREGLTIDNIKNSVGEVRLALGFIGLIFLFIYYRRKNFGLAIVSAWTVMLFIMSCAPHLLFVNLPSTRIGNYLSYPLSILSAYALYAIFNAHDPIFKKFKSFNATQNLIPLKFLRSAFLLLAIFVFATGLKDSADAFKKSPNFTPTLETFNASNYLKQVSAESDIILKDHNYLSGDTWMKLFFMRGYTYPLSRGYFKRYEDETKPREMCTLYMISNPNSSDANNCFSETGTKYLMVNPQYDSSQFTKLKNFDEIYNSGGVAIYYRK